MRRHLATAATLGNALAGASASVVALRGAAAEAILALVAVALVLDGIDGRLARRFGSIRLGARLDAAADLVSFVALPAVLLAVEGQRAAAVLFALSGAARLARFATAPDARAFRGLPSSVACAVVVLAATLGLPGAWQAGSAIVLAALMASPLPYPALRGRLARWLWPFVALIAAHSFVAVALPAWRAAALQSALLVVMAIVVGAPVVAMGRSRAGSAASPSKT